MSKTIKYGDANSVIVKHGDVELENVEVIIDRINSLMDEQRNKIKNESESELGDSDLLRYYRASLQLNMKVFSNVEVGFKNVKEEFFNGDYSDFDYGVMTGSYSSNSLWMSGIGDENQQYLQSYYTKSSSMVDAWNSLSALMIANMPKFTQIVTGGGPHTNEKNAYRSNFSSQPDVKNDFIKLSRIFNEADSIDQFKDSVEAKSIMGKYKSLNVEEVAYNESIINYLQTRKEYLDAKNNVYDRAGYAVAIYKNNDSYSDENILATGFLSLEGFDTEKKYSDLIKSFAYEQSLSFIISVLNNNVLTADGAETIPSSIIDNIKDISNWIDSAFESSMNNGLSKTIESFESVKSKLEYVQENYDELVAGIDENGLDAETKAVLNGAKEALGIIIGAATASTIAGGVVGGALIGAAIFGIHTLIKDNIENNEYENLVESYSQRVQNTFADNLSEEDYKK
jgi:hypothetical protein